LSGRCNQCDIIYKLDYYIKSEEKYLYQVDVCNSFICTSYQTVFEIKLLQWFHINLVRNTTSFFGFSDAFNEYHNNNNIVINSLYFVYQSNWSNQIMKLISFIIYSHVIFVENDYRKDGLHGNWEAH
jgi:hypothetical protein